MSAVARANGGTPLDVVVSKVQELAVLPHVVFKVLEITASEDAPASEIEKAITVDPGFSSKVLIMANSAAFGLPKRVTSIKEAITFLGFRTVRNIAMTVGVFDLFVGKTDRESLRRRAWWRQSIDSAVCAKWLAKETRKVNPDDAYTCALLHLIGKTLLDRCGGRDYDLVTQMTDLGEEAMKAEIGVYGCHHAEVAEAVSAKWGLPVELQQGLNYLMQPTTDEAPDRLRACTALSSAIAYYAKAGLDGETQRVLPTWALQLVGWDPEKQDEYIEMGTNVIAHAEF